MRVKSYIVLAYLGLTILYTFSLRAGTPDASARADLDTLPFNIDGYVGNNEPINDRALDVLGADQAAYRRYRRGDGRPIFVFLGYFGSPRENSQIHSPKHCYPGSGWTVMAESFAEVNVSDRKVVAKSLLINNGKASQLVLYWFQTDTGVITNEYSLKLEQMKSALLKRSQRTTFVRFSTPIGHDEDRQAVHAELAEFIEAITPHLTQALDRGDTEI